MRARVPSAQPLEVVTLDRYQLCFHKSSADQSAKCNAQYTGDPRDELAGVVYAMDLAQKPHLNRAEGLGHGYFHTEFLVQGQRDAYRTFAYLSHPAFVVDDLRPYKWYRELVLRGAEYHCFSKDYLDRIRKVECIDDPISERNGRMMKLAQSY